MVGHDAVSITTAVHRASVGVISNLHWFFVKISGSPALLKQVKTIPQLVLPAEPNRRTSPEVLIVEGAASRGSFVRQSRICDCVEMPMSLRLLGRKHDSKKKKDKDEDALKLIHGNLHRFQTDDNYSAFSSNRVEKLINSKNLPALKALGRFEGGLRTNLKSGLSLDEIVLDGAVRSEGATSGADKNTATFQPSALERSTTARTGPVAYSDSFNNRLRVFKDNPKLESNSKLPLGPKFVVKFDRNEGAWVDWVEYAIILAIVSKVGARNDWQKERIFVSLNKKVLFDAFAD
jgi:Ca2+-transporting ATPase